LCVFVLGMIFAIVFVMFGWHDGLQICGW
jgi:hypothetical protein